MHKGKKRKKLRQESSVGSAMYIAYKTHSTILDLMKQLKNGGC